MRLQTFFVSTGQVHLNRGLLGVTRLSPEPYVEHELRSRVTGTNLLKPSGSSTRGRFSSRRFMRSRSFSGSFRAGLRTGPGGEGKGGRLVCCGLRARHGLGHGIAGPDDGPECYGDGSS